ncbi:MAG TPA: M20/M25/M40 family metallo-hydrolase [Thermoanaerobaculia bacterium]|jgi:acetylornithine deacetylase/succinyl-diaminopimelate desuccinylase-like protein|nr:M20/M25/M40 family metallo-hydrolase [Thermoanaerobaculia bacterium]
MLAELLASTLLSAAAPGAAPASHAAEVANRYRVQHESAIVRDFVELLAIPNVPKYAAAPDGLAKNADEIARRLERRGIHTRRLEVPGAPPAIYGERPTPGATTTVVFYAHYDGQPVDPARWTNGDPFHPYLTDRALADGGKPIPFPAEGAAFDRESRLYARSAGDDKAPIVALLAALDALDEAGIHPTVNLKFFFEGEEEQGSPHLAQMLAAHRELLAADLWLFCDGPVHQSRRPQIVFGARGITSFEITVYGARRELHSGHYGNWAPNPAFDLARLLTSMKDAEGRVLIADFERGMEPIGDLERQALKDIPPIEDDLKRELWLGRTERAPERLEEAILHPSLNVRGLASAAVGEGARNVVPDRATAALDIRLVKGLDPGTMVDRVIAHVRGEGYFVTDREPTPEERTNHPRVARIAREEGGYRAIRTRMDLPEAQRVVAALEAAHGSIVRLPTLGGSLPLAAFDDVLGVPLLIVPIANHDDNQHTHDENLRLQNLWDGIETFAALFTM